MKNYRVTLQIAVGIAVLCRMATANLFAYPLTLEQRTRLKQYLPRTFPKLEARDPIHVVAVGDSVMLGYTPLPDAWESGNSIYTYPGVFLEKLAHEWFYTGGVKLLNPPKGGTSSLSQYLGDEIRFENLSAMDGVMLSGIQRTTTDAFLHKPDLLLIQYGVNDALANTSLDTYKRALYETIEAAKQQKTDVIVFGPAIANYGGGAMKWGITRPFTSAAKEICESQGVMFIDLGQHLMRWGGAGVDPDTDPQSAMEIVGDTLEKVFNYGVELEVKEKIHPCLRAHQNLGSSAFQEFLDGPPESDFSVEGVASFEGEGKIGVIMLLRNQSNEEKQGTVGALAIGQGLVPVVPVKRFKIPPGQKAQVEFIYRRTPVGNNRTGGTLYLPLELDDNVCRFPFVLEDTFSSEFLSLPLRVGPVSVAWKSKQFINISDRLRIEWNLINGTDKPLSGEYQIGYGDSVAAMVKFSIPPLGNKPYFAEFAFKTAADQFKFQNDVWIEVHSAGKVTRFDRELEASKDIIPGESIPMSSWASYVNAPPVGNEKAAMTRPDGKASVRFEVDETSLHVITQMDGITIPNNGKGAALRAILSIDARPTGEVRDFGFINPIVIYTRGTDGPGYTMPLELGTFGNGYNMILDSRGITSQLASGERGERTLNIRIPKTFLHRIDWKKISPDSVLGVKLELTPADPLANPSNPFDFKNSYVTNSASFNFRNKTVRGLGSKDARGLTTLRFSKEPVSTWSVRLY